MDSLREHGACTLADDACTSCGDVAVPVRVLAATSGLALCEDRTGQRARIALDFVGPVTIDDVLMVHAGVALTKISRVEMQPQ
jgi:hydrogenase expression/formation protein HypC